MKTDDSTKSPQVLPKLGAKLIAHETPGHYSVDLTPTTQDNPSHLVRRLDQSGIAQTLAPHSADHNVFHDSNVREGETYTYEVISQKDGVPIPNTTVRLTIPKDMVLSGEVSLESIKAGRLFLEKATLVSHGKQLTIEAQEIVSKGSTITVFNDSERSGSDPAHFSPGMISIKASRASGQLHIDARGVDGKDGAPGEPGAPGKPGEPGVTGRIGLNPIYVEKEHFTKELIEWATKDAQYINDGPGSVRDRLNDKRWERERQNGGHFMFIPSPAPGKGQPGSDGMPGTDGTSGTAAGNSAPVTVAIEQESTLKLTIDNEPGRPGQGGTGGKGGPGGTGGAPGARGPFIDEPFPPAGPEGKAGPDGKTGPTGHPGTRSPSLIKIGDKLIINSRELQ